MPPAAPAEGGKHPCVEVIFLDLSSCKNSIYSYYEVVKKGNFAAQFCVALLLVKCFQGSSDFEIFCAALYG